jgi:hypothetical protein
VYKAFTIGISANWLSNIVWTSAAPAAFESIHWAYYIFFIVQAAIGGIAALLFFPDTARKPPEEIAVMFEGRDNVVVFQRDLQVEHFKVMNSDEESIHNGERIEHTEGVRKS